MLSRLVFTGSATVLSLATLAVTCSVSAQESPVVVAAGDAQEPGTVISRHIFGQFAEMLGTGIYGGVWVGPQSTIPNVRGVRTDVVEALKALKVPNVRWPGGCYADQYHWRNGIGPAAQRPTTVNVNWGNVTDDNSFGTHEFMDFLDQIGSEAYLSVNVATGTVQEASDWTEYMTTDQLTTLGKERQANGRKEPWKIAFLGLGNEAWGCGGPYTPDAYVTQMKLFGTHVKNHNPAQRSNFMQPNPDGTQFVASAYELGKPEFTEAIMKAWSERLPYFWNIKALSLHHYTKIGDLPMQDASTDFGEDQYAALLSNTYTMNDLLAENTAIMDKYDPKKEVGLAIDEWGAWLKPLPGSNPMFLRQQNSLRDALLAAVNLNIFARHADRVRITNIAQMVNVIQSMILTDGPKMVLTPTYHVYKMYVPFQDATLIPLEVATGTYSFGKYNMPRVDAIAGKSKDGGVWVAAVNLHPSQATQFTLKLRGVAFSRAIGEVLTAEKIDSVNEFATPSTVKPVPFNAKVNGGTLKVRLQPRSVSVFQLLP
jgi:alpha-N-arabinofuranosidase